MVKNFGSSVCGPVEIPTVEGRRWPSSSKHFHQLKKTHLYLRGVHFGFATSITWWTWKMKSVQALDLYVWSWHQDQRQIQASFLVLCPMMRFWQNAFQHQHAIVSIQGLLIRMLSSAENSIVQLWKMYHPYFVDIFTAILTEHCYVTWGSEYKCCKRTHF